MECPEGIPRTVKIGHKVYDDIVDQDTDDGKGKIGERIPKCES
jgi:hypothetical protein